LFVGFAFLAHNREIDVVDIAARAIAHGRHKGRIKPVGTQ